MRSRTVLVTGASGLLGRRLVRAFRAAGWEVIAIGRPGRTALPGIRTVELDIEEQADGGDFAALDALGQSPDTVCHLAALIPPRHNDPQYASRCLRVNALPTLQLALWAARKGCRFLYTSSANVYAQDGAQSDQPAHEQDPVYPSVRACYYLSSKVAGELFVEHVRQTLGLSAIILRLSTLFGPGMPEKSVAARFISAAAAGGILEVWGGKARHDWIHVDDVVAAIIAVLKSEAQGVYNIGGGESPSVLEFARLVAEVYSDAGPTIRVREVTEAEDRGYRPVRIEKARQDWGFSPRSLVESIRSYRSFTEKDA